GRRRPGSTLRPELSDRSPGARRERLGFPVVMREPSEQVLELDHLTKAYGGRTAVDDLSLEVAGGEILGFVGPNGAGKTTTIRMALNLVRPTSGAVRILGQDVRRKGGRVLARVGARSEEHTSDLQSRENLVCRLLLEKK